MQSVCCIIILTSFINYYKIFINMIGDDIMIELEDNKRKLLDLRKRIESIGESL